MATKRHVLVVIKHPVGGIRTYLKYTYGRLDPLSYRFTIVVLTDPEASLITRDLGRFEHELVEIGEGRGDFALLGASRRLLGRGGVDIIHSQGLASGTMAALANIGRGLPHVVTHHDVFRPDQFAGWAGAFRKRALAAVLSRIDVVHCVGQDARANFLEYLPGFRRRADRVLAIANGIEPAPFTAATEVRARATADAGAPAVFGFIGRFMPQKGFEVLVDAVDRLRGAASSVRSFRVVAVNDGAFVREYKSLVRARGLAEFFEFPGFRPSIADALPGFSAVVMPSLWEAGPLAPMEVLVGGCPLIASDCIGLREVTAGTPALTVRAGDPVSLADAMFEVLRSEPELRAKALAFAPAARDRYDCGQAARSLEAVFDSLLAGRVDRARGKMATPAPPSALPRREAARGGRDPRPDCSPTLRD